MNDKLTTLVRLRLLTHNQRLVEARKEKGWTQQDLALLTGIHVQRLGHIELLKCYPSVDEAEDIASALDKPREWLFLPELVRFREVRRIVCLTAEQAKNLSWIQPKMLPGPDDSKIGLPEGIKDVFDTLNPRERKVLTLRFGLDGSGSRTLEEVGKEFGRTRERIRQFEAKALRKLRHPSRSRKLRDFL